MKNNFAYCTLLSTDSYLDGTFFFNEAFQKTNSKYPLNIIITSNCSPVTHIRLKHYCKNFNNVIVRELKAVNFNNEDLTRFKTTLNKFQIINFKEYEKVLFLDLDLFLLKNIDFLFNKIDEKLYCTFNEIEFFGLTNSKGEPIQLEDFLSPERFNQLKKEFPDSRISAKPLSKGGIFMIKPSEFNFDEIVNKYRSGLSMDEFVLDDIVLHDNELYKKLHVDDNIFKNLLPTFLNKENLLFTHFKYWQIPLLSNKKYAQKFIELFLKNENTKKDLIELTFGLLENSMAFNPEHKLQKEIKETLLKYLEDVFEKDNKDFVIEASENLLKLKKTFSNEEINELKRFSNNETEV